MNPDAAARVSLKRHFSRFLAAAPGRLHFAAHSHHGWPDVTWDAHLQAWKDAAELADLKWDKVFGEVFPAAQAHVARQLSLPDPETVAFAPSTHDLITRVLSCLDRPVRILTTARKIVAGANAIEQHAEGCPGCPACVLSGPERR